jgi:hypothetical protein
MLSRVAGSALARSDPGSEALGRTTGVPVTVAERRARVPPSGPLLAEERGHARGWRHEAGTGTHGSGQLATPG